MIVVDAKEVEKARILFHKAPNLVEAATVDAINRTSTAVKTFVSKTIRANYLVSAKDVKSALGLKRATKTNLVGIITSVGEPPLITAFRVKVYKKGPVKVQVLKKGKPKKVRGLFMGTSLKGYVGAMQRKDLKMRYPLRIPHGPSVPQMFSAQRSMSSITPFAEKTLNQRFVHEIDYRFNKYGGKK